MKRILCIASILALPWLALALDPPANFNADYADGDEFISTSWDPVEGATKYSVNVYAEYDTDGDGIGDMSEDFDFGTSDRDDGYLMSDPFLNIPFAAISVDIDVNEDGNPDTLTGAMARVKALNPGKGNGRQNHPFSASYVFFPVL